jgi:hypothetical protein
MINLEVLISDIIQTYENDICCGITDQKEYELVKEIFADLIILLTRLHLGIRYCSNKNCSCSPEWNLKKHISDNEYTIKHYFNYGFDSLEDIV